MSEVGTFADRLSIVPGALSNPHSYAPSLFVNLESKHRSQAWSFQKGPASFPNKRGPFPLGIFGGIAFVGVALFILQFHTALLPFLRNVEIPSLLGIGIEQVTLSGHRSTSDTDIFEALKLDTTTTYFGFKSAEVETRLKHLPWIKEVSLKRVWPNQVALHFTEREPFALWRHGQGTVLIDQEGRTLGALTTEEDLPLPKFMGEGANVKALEFWRLLQSYPQFRTTIASAEYVSNRRWTVKLKNGVVLDLPAGSEGSALSLVTAQSNLKELLEKPGCHIDLRIPRRIILREDPKLTLNPCLTPASRESQR